MSLACPACGGELLFKSRFTAMSICPFCQSVLLRKDEHWLQSGTMAVMPADMSPFQVGTQGTYLNKSFEMIGQLKVAWSEGFWNEWYLIESNGNAAWLAEAMGFLSYSQEIALTEPLGDPKALRINQTLTLANESYTISDIKSYECIGCVGELPFEFTTGNQGISIDLISTDDDCAYLEHANGQYRFFKGKNVSFDDLAFTNLRALDGW